MNLLCKTYVQINQYIPALIQVLVRAFFMPKNEDTKIFVFFSFWISVWYDSNLHDLYSGNYVLIAVLLF